MKKDRLILAFAGDVMLGRLVNDYVILGDKVVDYIWGDMLPYIKNADLRLINLENAISSRGSPWAKTPKVFFYKADPKAIDVLKAAHVDYVTLANNHVLDFGEEAFLDTINYLDKARIKHAGGGKTLRDAQKPAMLKSQGFTIGVVAFTDNMPEWAAAETKPGINYIEVSLDKKNFGQLKKSIEEAKSKSDIVVVSAHWGPNMRQRPTSSFKEFARAVIDAGADIFHGHSAHIFQGIEIYKQKVIMYDTGDFVDDYAIDEELRNDQTFLFLVSISRYGVEKIELIPAIINQMQVNMARGDDLKGISSKMINLCKEFGTKVELEKDRLIIRL